MKLINVDTHQEYELDTIELFQKLVDYKYGMAYPIIERIMSWFPLISHFYIDETTNNITIDFNTGVSIATKSIGLLGILQECADKLSLSELEADDTTTPAYRYESGIDIQDGVFIKEEL